MNKYMLIGLFLLCIFCIELSAQTLPARTDLIRLNAAMLHQTKKSIHKSSSATYTMFHGLLRDADSLMSFAPVSVMMKKDFPPSGSKHDYMSIAPYWWPDPSKPGGVPYIRRDGEINPEVSKFSDKNYLPQLCEYVYYLSLAYHFSGDEKYAAHASDLVRTWFIESSTRMNPNLNFGQSVKGVTDGRAEGLIDTRNFIFLIDGLKLLDGSRNWHKTDASAMKSWFSSFSTWMYTSRIGKDELGATNNHGVWYDAQSLAIALYIDSIDLAHRIVSRTINRLDKTMLADGSFPEEMARTTSLHYSVFNLNAFFMVATLADQIGIDLWHMNTNSGKSLEKAFEFVRPYMIKQLEWKSKQIKSFLNKDAYAVLFYAAQHYGCNECIDFIKQCEGEHFQQQLFTCLMKK